MNALQLQLWLGWFELGWVKQDMPRGSGYSRVPQPQVCSTQPAATSAMLDLHAAPLPPPTAADAALVCCLLVIYTDLLEWNALGGAFGMV